jgi:hypothetical protein
MQEPKLAECRVCGQTASRYLPGRKRSFYCPTHGPTKAEDWLRLESLGTAAQAPPVSFSVSANAEEVAELATRLQSAEEDKVQAERLRDAAQRAEAAERREKEAAQATAREAQRNAREVTNDCLRLDTEVQTTRRRLEAAERQREEIAARLRHKEEEMSDLAGKTAELARSNSLLSEDNANLRKYLEEATSPMVVEPPPVGQPREPEPEMVRADPPTFRAPRPQVEPVVDAPKVPLLADALRTLKRGRTGLALASSSAAEHSFKKLNVEERENVMTVLRFLSAEGFKGVKAAPLLLKGRNEKDKYTAVRFTLRGRIVLAKQQGYYEVADITDRADRRWYSKEGR